MTGTRRDRGAHRPGRRDGEHLARRGLSLRSKVLITTLAVGGAAGVAGLGTFGTFTSTTSASTPTDATGTLTLDFGPNGTTNRLSVGAVNMAAGDTLQRGFSLRDSGSLAASSIALTMSDASPSLLDSSAGSAYGLTVEIDKCSSGFVESGSTPYTYTCSGTRSVILAATPVATVETAGTAGVTLPGLNALSPAGIDSLEAIFTLPATAPNTYQGLSSTLSIAFTAIQRTATSQ